jgi:hypothetical protein
MSRPESRKTKYPTKVAEAAAPAPPVTPRRVGIGTLLRGAVALALVAVVPMGWSFYANYLNANIVSRIGEFKTQAPNGLLLGMSDLRRAYTMNPHNPDNQYRYATAILKEESQKVRAKDLRTVDFAHLSECLSLLREAQRSHLKPHFVQLKFAEAANLVIRFLQMAGQKDRVDPFVQEAVSNLVAFRNQQGIMQEKPAVVYGLAIDLSANDPARALTFWEDYAREFGDETLDNPDVMLRVARAHAWLGEFHLMNAMLANLAVRYPQDARVTGMLEESAKRYGQRPAVLAILGLLEREGKLSGAGQALKRALSADASSQ